MKQLAENPVFQQNPSCLGEFLERLAQGAAVQSVNPPPERELPDSQAEMMPLDGPSDKPCEEARVGAYKSYWSKYKRPASHVSDDVVPVTPAVEVIETPKRLLPDNQLGDSSL
jgi:hypothetical protein